jgi:hypothetical protein
VRLSAPVALAGVLLAAAGVAAAVPDPTDVSAAAAPAAVPSAASAPADTAALLAAALVPSAAGAASGRTRCSPLTASHT